MRLKTFLAVPILAATIALSAQAKTSDLPVPVKPVCLVFEPLPCGEYSSNTCETPEQALSRQRELLETCVRDNRKYWGALIDLRDKIVAEITNPKTDPKTKAAYKTTLTANRTLLSGVRRSLGDAQVAFGDFLLSSAAPGDASKGAIFKRMGELNREAASLREAMWIEEDAVERATDRQRAIEINNEIRILQTQLRDMKGATLQEQLDAASALGDEDAVRRLQCHIDILQALNVNVSTINALATRFGDHNMSIANLSKLIEDDKARLAGSTSEEQAVIQAEIDANQKKLRKKQAAKLRVAAKRAAAIEEQERLQASRAACDTGTPSEAP